MAATPLVRGWEVVIGLEVHAQVTSNATGRNNPDRVRSVIYNDNGPNSTVQPGQAATSTGQSATKTPAAPAKKP